MPTDFNDADNKPYLEAILQELKPKALWILGEAQVEYSESIVKASGVPYLMSIHPSWKFASFKKLGPIFDRFLKLS
jgi:hypothetical protein